MNGGDDDGFFSSDIVLLVGVLVGFVLLVQFGVVASIGEWLGHLMVDGVKAP